MCMIDGAEKYSIWKEKTITKARTEHKCDECGRAIAKGETYTIYKGFSDGEWSTHPICRHCIVACGWLRVTCHGFIHTCVLEDIEEHAREYRRFDLYRLVVGMRRKWKGGLMRVPKLPKPISIAA